MLVTDDALTMSEYSMSSVDISGADGAPLFVFNSFVGNNGGPNMGTPGGGGGGRIMGSCSNRNASNAAEEAER